MITRILVVAFSLAVAPLCLAGEIHAAAELSVSDLEELDRSNTVVILPGGLFEEHGPYLPTFTDGYLNQTVSAKLASQLAENGHDILMFPIIPIGSGSPEDFGGLPLFSGSYTVRPDTLRSLFMDLGAALGDDGFRHIFIIHYHGSPGHNRALLEASEYFNDHYEGEMVPLSVLLYAAEGSSNQVFDATELAENGLPIHAGAHETSRTMFIRPDLVSDDYVEAPAVPAHRAEELSEIARSAGWQGYFGSPRLATAGKGEELVASRVAAVVELATKVLDGFDWRQLPNRADIAGLPRAFVDLDETNLARAKREEARQQRWLDQQSQSFNSK
ncbi:MAG: creatininase family protein [Woeseiaceae bacterium]|nr:creatininase family protein [Woeseiaceae bacterium]